MHPSLTCIFDKKQLFDDGPVEVPIFFHIFYI